MSKKFKVEDHGNGFMVIGTLNPQKARKVLKDYVDKVKRYRFATPTYYGGRSACWLTTHPGAHWEDSLDHAGKPLPR